MSWDEVVAAHLQDSIAGTECSAMAMAMARGELGWANAVAAGAPPLPGWLISSGVSLVALFGLRAGSSIKCIKEAASLSLWLPPG